MSSHALRRDPELGLGQRLRRRIHEPSTLAVGYGSELRVMRSKFAIACAVLGLGVALVLPAVIQPHHLHLMNLSLIAVIGAVALNLLVGTAGLISLGQAAFLAAGAFSAGARS
jgi:hypothetical protein